MTSDPGISTTDILDPVLYYTLDIETAGYHPDAPIIEIGICATCKSTVEPEDFQQLYYVTSTLVLPLRLADLKADYETILFHLGEQGGPELLRQSMQLYVDMVGNGRITTASKIPVKNLWDDFRQTYVGSVDRLQSKIWFCRGTDYDFPRLKSLMESHEIQVPWKWYNCRDSRSIEKFLSPKHRPFVRQDWPKHRAGPDATHEARSIAEFYCDIQGDDPSKWMIL